MSNIRPLAIAASTGLVLAFAGSGAHANVLAPGGTVTPDILPRMLTGDPIPVAATSGTFTSNMGVPDFSGSYAEFAFRGNSYGTNDLTWYIEVTNNTFPDAADIETISASSFKGFTTDVGYCQTTGVPGDPSGACFNEGTVLPTDVRRTSNGTAINFDLALPPGSTTDWLMIVTNATQITSGNLSFIDEGTASVSAYAPAAVPEASTWAMMGLGFAGLAFAGYRSRRTAISIA